MPPLVSVIIATYNRSNILPFAIQCVQRQTVSDWELIVVGDACTDDTEQVVAQFGDARIRFINLPENVGEQSGPSNAGLQQARGQYIAFLNHDDFWFADHLAVGIETLQMSRAAFSVGIGASIQPDGLVNTVGRFVDNQYRPNYFVPASGWVFGRDVLAAVPNWRSYGQLWIFPSHDFLRRVYQAGLPIVPTNRFTYVLIPSGNRPNSYRDRHTTEHQAFFSQLTDNLNWRTELLTKMLLNAAYCTEQGGWRLIWQGFKNMIKQPLIRRGIITTEWRLRLKHVRKGGELQSLRVVQGLSRIARK